MINNAPSVIHKRSDQGILTDKNNSIVKNLHKYTRYI